MNVFVLCTGRCGSSTFIEACHHIANYTSAHESRSSLLGAERLAYPAQHIEADNRLSWLLGRLDAAYGDSAFYVHLQRNHPDTAASFVSATRAASSRPTGVVASSWACPSRPTRWPWQWTIATPWTATSGYS